MEFRSYHACVIQAVIFDVGGVLIRSPIEQFEALESDAGMPKGTMIAMNMTNPDTNAWACFERGEIDEYTFLDRLKSEAALLGYDLDPSPLLRDEEPEFHHAMVKFAHQLSRTLPVALLTNNFPIPAHRRVLSTFDFASIVIESSQIGMRKPEPRIYHHAAAHLGVSPSDCVYLDDLGINLKPARSLGFATIKVASPEHTITELQGLLATQGIRLER
jgi:putative hydrolase of the HAD superfamily